MTESYSIITETPGIGASREQLSMLYTRYRFASEYCRGKDVLEVACGSGQGLGYLAKVAKSLVGGDIDENNLRMASEHYRNRGLDIRKLDAHRLDFPDASFDVVILFEAIYYLSDPQKFLLECRRVLRKGGLIIISSVNREWKDFNPSPFSTRYFSASELHDMMGKFCNDVKLLASFPAHNASVRGQLISWVKRIAIRLHLIPNSMKGKVFLKRIFMGKLTPLPAEVTDGMATYKEPTFIDPTLPQSAYKMLYAIGSVS